MLWTIVSCQGCHVNKPVMIYVIAQGWKLREALQGCVSLCGTHY